MTFTQAVSVEVTQGTAVTADVQTPAVIGVEVGGIGPPGPPGPGGTSTFTGVAAVAISGQTVVTTDCHDGIEPASSQTPGPHWFATTAALAGAALEYLAIGPWTDASWNWTPGAALFVDANGTLTETCPQAGYATRVAIATSPTSIFFAPTHSILLAD